MPSAGFSKRDISQAITNLYACLYWVQGRPLVERLKGGIGQFLGISDGRRPQPQQQLVGAKLQGEAREALIAALAVRSISTLSRS